MLQLEGLSQDLFRRVLHTLWRICSKQRILPGPHLLPEGLLRTDDTEIASGGFASIRRGEFTESSSSPDARSVCIKTMKVTVKDGTEGRCNVEKVGDTPFLVTNIRDSRLLDVLRGDLHLDEIKASKYCPVPWRYK